MLSAAGHPLARRPTIAVADLAGKPWAAGHHGTDYERMITRLCGLLSGRWGHAWGFLGFDQIVDHAALS
jgi:hypothetical protein